MDAGQTRHDTGAGTVSSTSIPYVPADQETDVRRGKVDGRRRTPSYTQVSERIAAEGSFTTAYGEELRDLGSAAMCGEVDAYEHAVAPKHRRVAGLRELLATIGDEIERARESLGETAVELTPEELTPRNPIEAQRGPDLISSRRWAARERRARTIRCRIAALEKQTDTVRRQIAELDEEIEQDLDRAKVRVDMQAAHTALRAATYWRALTETHPEGRQLAVVAPRVQHSHPVWPDGRTGDETSDEGDEG